MNKLIQTTKQLLCLMLLVPSAWAGSGQAIVPIWGGGKPGFFTAVNVSNITDNPLLVTITFYGKKGNVIPATAIGSDNIDANGILAANNTVSFATTALSTVDYGYAVIHWQNQSGDDRLGLVAQGLRINNDFNGRSEYAIPINNGMPF